MSINENDRELMEAEIDMLCKYYKVGSVKQYPNWGGGIPDEIKAEIEKVLKVVGYCCWFGDWINHKIYTWVFTECLLNGDEPVPYLDYEEINMLNEKKYKYQLRFERKNGDVDFAEFCGKWEWDSKEELLEYWKDLRSYVKKRKAVSYYITKAWGNLEDENMDYEIIWDSKTDN